MTGRYETSSVHNSPIYEGGSFVHMLVSKDSDEAKLYSKLAVTPAKNIVKVEDYHSVGRVALVTLQKLTALDNAENTFVSWMRRRDYYWNELTEVKAKEAFCEAYGAQHRAKILEGIDKWFHRCFSDVRSGVGQLKRLGWVHTDLHGQNVMKTAGSGRYKLIDFDLLSRV